MPLNGKLTKAEVTALENSYLSYEGVLGPNQLLYDLDELLLTRGNGQGLKLYDKLLDDAHIYAVMRKLAGAIASREWTVTPGSDKRLEKKAADIVREQLLNLNTKDINPTEENHTSVKGFDALTTAFVMGGVLNGRHFGEVMWATEGNRTIAVEVRSRDPRQFAFAKGNYGYVLRHLTKENSWSGVEVPLKKILAWSHGGLDGNPYGRAMGRVLFWPNFFKKNGIRFWLKFVERFAAPKPTGRYPRGATPQQVAELRAALAAFANETEIAIPEGMLIEYLEAASSGTIDTYQSLCAFMDAQISRAVLGETGTTDQTGSGGSRARDQVGNEVRLEISKAIADSLSYSFNRLATWITDYNLPGAIPPKIWRVFDEQEDLNGRVNRDKTLFDLGYRINAETVTSTYGEGYDQAGGETEKPALISSLGVGGVQALTGLLTQAATGQLPRDNAIAALVSVFGIDEAAAGKMVPDAPEPATPQANPLDQLFGGQDGGNINGNVSGGTDGGNNSVGAGAAFSEDEGDRTLFAEPSQDTADRIVEKARPLIRGAIAPWLTTITNFVEQAQTLEEIRDGLVDLYPDLDGAAFAEAMGQAMLLSDLAGRDEVLGDDADVAFGEMLEAAIATGTIEFAASSGKKPNCNAAKSHFCQTANGRGSCVPLSKKCAVLPTGNQVPASGFVAPTSPATTSPAAAPPPAAKAKTTKAKKTAAAAPPATVPPVTPAVPATVGASPAAKAPAIAVQTNDFELKSKRDALVAKFGHSTIDDAEANTKKLLADSGVYMKVPNAEVMAFVLGDKFKTAHELGGRPGAPPPGDADDYLGARARVEKKVLGVARDIDGSDRPKYGYLGGKDLNGAEHLDVSGAYGNITVEFKPEVRDRATFTGADSFKSGIASKIDAPNAASLVSVTKRGIDQNLSQDHDTQLKKASNAKNLSELAEGLAPQGNTYLEAQIHGQLTPKDIKALHFRPTGYHDSPSPEVVKFAKDQGVDIYINGKLTPHDKIKPQLAPARIRDLSNAVTKGDVSKTEDLVARLETDLKTQQTKAPGKFGGADPMQNLLAQKAGFADKPKVVDSAEFDKLAASSHIVMYRGVNDGLGATGKAIQQQFMDGDYHSGHGVYGHGNYFAHGANTRNGIIQKGSGSDALDKQAKDVAIDYSTRGYTKGSSIIRTALSEDAKIATSAQVIQLQRTFAQKIDAEIEVRKKAALDHAPKLTPKAADVINKDVDAMNGSFTLSMSKERISKEYTGTFGRRDLTTATYVLDGKNKRPEFLGSALRKFGLTDTIDYQLTDPSGKPNVHLTDAPMELKKYMQEKYKDKIPVASRNNGLNWIKFDSADEMNAAIEESVKELIVIKKHGALGTRKAGDPTADGYKWSKNAGESLKRLKDEFGLSSSDKEEPVNARFAIAMGIDAVAVSSTTGKADERSQYINVLNRSKLIVDSKIYKPTEIKKVKRP